MSAAMQLGISCADALFQPGQAEASLSGLPGGEVLAMVGSFQDELAILRTLDRGRWRAVLSVAAGVDEVLEALGDRREGLIGPAQWTPASVRKPAPALKRIGLLALTVARSGLLLPIPPPRLWPRL